MRIDFPEGVKETVAKRNGFRCSFPGCDTTTVGPGESPDHTMSTGVAAHIHSASPKGPRGQATLSLQELKDVANALWLCANHARVVDANRGVEFPPIRLHSFKAVHEAQIAFEQRGVSFKFGWLQSLVVEESPIFIPGSRLDFGRTTMIVGGNASGKTALCEWLAGCTEISFLKRWSPLGKRGKRTQVRYEALNPLSLTWTIRIYDKTNIHFTVNDSATPRLNLPYAFIHAPERPNPRKAEDETVSAYLARWLRIDVALVHNAVRSLAASGGHHIHNPRFVERDGLETLLVDVDDTLAGLSFEDLSDTEQTRVVIEIAVELARSTAERRPTMLVVDCMARFDGRWFQDYAAFIAAQTRQFQAVVTAPTEDALPATVSLLDGHHVARLRQPDAMVRIE